MSTLTASGRPHNQGDAGWQGPWNRADGGTVPSHVVHGMGLWGSLSVSQSVLLSACLAAACAMHCVDVLCE
jgi:hypothetical protein